MNIDFVSYTGAYPNLCRGVLTLKIGEKEYKFGHDSKSFNWKIGEYDDDNYNAFWVSGGSCYFTLEWDGIVEADKWIINVSELPTWLKPYSDDIIRVFNKNVRYGCCGGCL